MTSSYDDFFKRATGHEPYDYQRRLACGIPADDENKATWLSHGAECDSRLIDIPTRLGKTAAQPSWAERMLDLRNDPDIIPLRLAYWETLLRAADARASATHIASDIV